VGDKTYKLSLLPSGIIRGKFSVIGSGVVVDPIALFSEIKKIEEAGIKIESEKLAIAENACLILSVHRELDQLLESKKGEKKIGTTGRGIGPAYEDKVGRRALRICDLRDQEVLKNRIENLLFYHNLLRQSLGAKKVELNDILQELKPIQNKILDFDYSSPIEPMIHDGLKYKIDILSRDEFDKGERKFLNFGHTFGHALESTSEHIIPHGIAVIIGSMIAVMVSKELGYDVPNYDVVIEKGISLIKETKSQFKLEWFDLDLLLEIIKSDKKSIGKLTMVLVNDKPFLEDIEDVSILQKVLNQIYEVI
jgi:hypothetical protein